MAYTACFDATGGLSIAAHCPDRSDTHWRRLKTVLLAEPDDGLRNSLAATLKDAGCYVIEAADPEQALGALDVVSVDLLVTKLALSKSDKRRWLIDRCRSLHGRGAPIICIAGGPSRSCQANTAQRRKTLRPTHDARLARRLAQTAIV